VSSHHRNQPLVRKGQPPYHEDYDPEPYSLMALALTLFVISATFFAIAGVLAYVN